MNNFKKFFNCVKNLNKKDEEIELLKQSLRMSRREYDYLIREKEHVKSQIKEIERDEELKK